MVQSMVCKYADFARDWYRTQERSLQIRTLYSWHSANRQYFANRKFWEWCAITQALEERGLLREGSRGLGFAVGTEPLTAYFASRGCTVLATDLDASMSNPEWISTGQHAASLEALFQPLFVDRAAFEQRVSFQPVDMRRLDGLSPGYDFLWSSCAFEHLGTLGNGIEFVLRSAELLRPGGVAVHTTEFNVDSDDRTVEAGGNVIYRRRDILALGEALARRGMRLVPPDFDTGDHPYDLEADRPPYMESDLRHIKLLLDGFVSTSMLLIIERPLAG